MTALPVVHGTPIPGLLVVDLPVHGDARGWFKENWQRAKVRAGQVLGQCGNSGNSSDPHVHVQLMDGPDITTATGLPFTWTYLEEEGAVRTGVPANEELFTAVAEEAAR